MKLSVPDSSFCDLFRGVDNQREKFDLMLLVTCDDMSSNIPNRISANGSNKERPVNRLFIMFRFAVCDNILCSMSCTYLKGRQSFRTRSYVKFLSTIVRSTFS
jgi:hypothetical protein